MTQPIKKAAKEKKSKDQPTEDRAPLTVVKQFKLEPEWEGKRVFIGFPCYKYTNPATMWAMFATALDIGKDKIQADIAFGDAQIHHARNKLAHKFLESPCEWLIMLDDDMIPPIGRPGFLADVARLNDQYPEDAASLHWIHRLTSHKDTATLVGATYFERTPNGRAVNGLREDEEYVSKAMVFANEILPTDWIGTGCIMIHRSVFDAIKANPEMSHLEPNEMGGHWDFFRPGVPGLDGAGEDIAFCFRAKASGHQPYVDCALHALHVGYGVYQYQTSGYFDKDSTL